MKILIRNSDSIVIYAQDDLILDTEAHGNNWRDPNFNSTNATIVDAALPRLWSGAVWSYIDGVWSVVDSVRYAELSSSEKAEVKQRDVAKAQADLAALDLKSIRAMREQLAAKPDAPAFIKQHETDAAALRTKLK